MFSTPGLNRKPSRASRLFPMSVKSNPPPKVPQPERLDEVYESLKKGLQSVLLCCCSLERRRGGGSSVLTGHARPCQVLLAGPSDRLGQPEQANERVQEKLQTGKTRARLPGAMATPTWQRY